MRRLSLLISALLFSAFAHATSTANIGSISCSGSQSFVDLATSATLSCNGDFSLIGGSIDSDTEISISAVGSLFLDNLTISAPLVQLKTFSGVLTFANGVSIISAGSINIDIGNATSPRITLAPGATLSFPGRGGTTIGTGGDITLSAGGNINLSDGSNLTRVSTVPEPDSFWSMLSGCLILLVIGRTRLKRPA
jgi:hypothetical protein